VKFVYLLSFGAAMFFINCTGGDPIVEYVDNTFEDTASNYDGRTIKPNNRTPAQLFSDVKTKYNKYREDYLKQASGKKYYIQATGNGENGEIALTISEAHGYGMIIFALVNFKGDEKTIFDGMNALRKAQHSRTDPDLMSWIVTDVDSDDAAVDNSATDGDLDNAYALLLAHKRWGEEKYLNEAKILIEAIKRSEMHQDIYRTKLGDWHNRWSSNNNATRSSDWMPGHFRAFYKATGDDFWLQTANMVYSLLNEGSNSRTGLIPDFVTGSPIVPDPLGGGTGEKNAQHYSYNACRVPWRLAADYAHHGTPAAKMQIDKISSWINDATGGNSNGIKDGYQLNGTPIGSSSSKACFVAPFAAGMIANAENQNFLNKTYSSMLNLKSDVYNDAINLLCMLLISGYWWTY